MACLQPGPAALRTCVPDRRGRRAELGCPRRGEAERLPGTHPSGERAALGVGETPTPRRGGGGVLPQGPCCSRGFLLDLPPLTLSGFLRLEAFPAEARGPGAPGARHRALPCESGRASWPRPVQRPASGQVRVNPTRAKRPRGILASLTMDTWSPNEDPHWPPGIHVPWPAEARRECARV